ncbi:hypothetical protein LZ554_008665 [Drepanopeziza brunnea f. sp. 'monogermtubi']|nr:hypothetical protein LZ554_008665 [Drepanopeziza brunnea f. sp. 'monogermtubi']
MQFSTRNLIAVTALLTTAVNGLAFASPPSTDTTSPYIPSGSGVAPPPRQSPSVSPGGGSNSTGPYIISSPDSPMSNETSKNTSTPTTGAAPSPSASSTLVPVSAASDMKGLGYSMAAMAVAVGFAVSL